MKEYGKYRSAEQPSRIAVRDAPNGKVWKPEGEPFRRALKNPLFADSTNCRMGDPFGNKLEITERCEKGDIRLPGELCHAPHSGEAVQHKTLLYSRPSLDYPA